MTVRRRAKWIHGLVVAVAAGADVAAFYQVIGLVMKRQSDAVVALLVIGFTATVLYLAHAAGMLLRDRAEGRRRLAGIAMIVICIAAWLILGGLAFHIRATDTSDLTSTSTGILVNGRAAGSAPDHLAEALNRALMFAGLYLATGLVAGLGAYFSHDPHGLVRSARDRAAYAEEAVLSSAVLGQVAGAQKAQVAAREAAVQTLESERRALRARAEQLKQYARLRIAQRAQDPALTDALFEPDRHPYWPAASTIPSPNGQSPLEHPVPRS